MFDRIRIWWQRRADDADRDTSTPRIDAMVAARGQDELMASEGGSIPPNYLPTGVNEHRPQK